MCLPSHEKNLLGLSPTFLRCLKAHLIDLIASLKKLVVLTNF